MPKPSHLRSVDFVHSAPAAQDAPARASGEADEPAADVVATLRALLARGERDAAVSLAREYAARRPAPALLPPDLRYLLEDTAR